MVAVYNFSLGIDDKKRRSLIFQGGIIIFKLTTEHWQKDGPIFVKNAIAI